MGPTLSEQTNANLTKLCVSAALNVGNNDGLLWMITAHRCSQTQWPTAHGHQHMMSLLQGRQGPCSQQPCWTMVGSYL